MKRFIDIALQMTILGYAFFHFITVFWKYPPLEQLLSTFGFAMFILAIFHVSIRKFKLPFVLLIIGTSILLYSGTDLMTGISNGMRQMRGIVGLLIVMPLIGTVLREEPYIEDIMALFHRFINTSKRFYFSIVAFTQVIAYFLLFASIPMMHQFINVILKEQTSLAWENYKSTALLRGFALSTVWVISIPSFIFAIETLEASLTHTILQGMGVAFLGTLMAVTFAHFQEKHFKIELTPTLQKEIDKAVQHASPKAVRVKKVIEFSLLFIALFGSVFLLHSFFHIKLMTLIPIVIVFIVISFYVIKGRSHRLPKVFAHYVKHDLSPQAYQLNVMLAVGVLIFGLNQTNFPSGVVHGLAYLQQTIPFINILFLLPFIIIFLGLIGLGPLTVMVLVAGILESMAFPYPPELIVLAITSGSVISILISPLIMPIIVLNAANQLGLYTNGIKFNWKYSIAFYILVQIYLQIAAYFGIFS